MVAIFSIWSRAKVPSAKVTALTKKPWAYMGASGPKPFSAWDIASYDRARAVMVSRSAWECRAAMAVIWALSWTTRPNNCATSLFSEQMSSSSWLHLPSSSGSVSMLFPEHLSFFRWRSTPMRDGSAVSRLQEQSNSFRSLRSPSSGLRRGFGSEATTARLRRGASGTRCASGGCR